jgi:transcription-repair coupling factor (superfamily II helicase)
MVARQDASKSCIREPPASAASSAFATSIKQLCRAAGEERVEAGPKGAVISFRNNAFANPEKLIAFIARQGSAFKLRPDHRLAYRRTLETPADPLTGVRDLTRALARIAGG